MLRTLCGLYFYRRPNKIAHRCTQIAHTQHLPQRRADALGAGESGNAQLPLGQFGIEGPPIGPEYNRTNLTFDPSFPSTTTNGI